jgi:PAS domain S-box-containing protein
MSDWVVLMDVKGRILRTNDIGEEFVGVPVAEMAGQTCCKLVHGSDTPLPNCPMLKMLRTSQRETTELQLPGSNRWLRTTVDPVIDEKGTVVGAVHIVSDITERKKVEDVLRRSEEKYRGIFDESITAVYVFDEKKHFIDSNQAGLDLLGYSRDELLSMSIPDVDADPVVVLPAHKQLLSGRNIVNYEHQLRRKDGMIITVLNNSRPLTDAEGNIIGMQSTLIDITERKKAEQERVTAVQERAAVIDAMSDALVVINLDGEIISCNPAHLRMIGHSSANEIVGKHFSELSKSFCDPEEDIPRLLGIFKGIIQNGFSEPVEVRVRRTDGKELTVSASVSVQRDAMGNPLNVIAILRDITPQKRLQEMEREAAVTRMAVETIEGMLEGITIMDLNGTIRQVNSEFERRSGYKREEVIGKKAIDLGIISKKENQMIEKEIIPKLMNEGLVRNIETVAMSRDGTRFPILMSWRLIKDAQGNPKSIITTATDITERKRAEEELKRSKEYLNNIINALDDPVFVKDEQHRWVVLNDAACEVMGRSREELIGKSDYDLFPKEQAAVFWERDNFVLKSGRTDVNEEEITWHGKLHTISTKKSPLTDSLTGKKYIAGTIRDVTERKRWEEKLLEYQEQLRLMASELSLAEERERRRIATELHDRIGQNLALSMLRLDNLRKSVSSGALAAPLGEISNLLEKTIQDTRSLTLDLSSPILYRFGFERTIADWLMQEVQKRHGIKSEFEDDGRPKPLEEDICVLLFQVTRELLINVVKHAQAHVVKVSVRRKGGEIETIVEDDGIGLDLSEIESVMPSKGKFGLFSIRERLNYLGGNIKIESESGHGTRVILTAPLKREKEATGED